MRILLIFGMVVSFLVSCTDSGSSQGTDVGNAFDGAAMESIELANEQAEEGVYGIVAESSAVESTGLSIATTGLSTSLRTPGLFSGSYRRPRLLRPFTDCPDVSRSENSDAGTVTITRNFDSCRPLSNSLRIYEGSTLISIIRGEGDNPAGESVNRTGTIDRDLDIELPTGRVLSIDAMHEFETSGTYPDIGHRVTLDGQRTRTSSGGRTLSDYDFRGVLDYRYSGLSEITSLSVSGTMTMTNRRVSRDIVSVFDSVGYDTSCCHPTSGRVTQTVTLNNEVSEQVIEFSSTCGVASLNGSSFELDECD